MIYASLNLPRYIEQKVLHFVEVLVVFHHTMAYMICMTKSLV